MIRHNQGLMGPPNPYAYERHLGKLHPNALKHYQQGHRQKCAEIYNVGLSLAHKYEALSPEDFLENDDFMMAFCKLVRKKRLLRGSGFFFSQLYWNEICQDLPAILARMVTKDHDQSALIAHVARRTAKLPIHGSNATLFRTMSLIRTSLDRFDLDATWEQCAWGAPAGGPISRRSGLVDHQQS